MQRGGFGARHAASQRRHSAILTAVVRHNASVGGNDLAPDVDKQPSALILAPSLEVVFANRPRSSVGQQSPSFKSGLARYPYTAKARRLGIARPARLRRNVHTQRSARLLTDFHAGRGRYRGMSGTCLSR